ncbi:MAG: hypothetical protein RLZZ127_1761 [Planctomycetota bacterium]|jgi:sterol desaturase/sphingolipid hydroxylase (fatty acid hydroxylase superfamily)
MIPWTDPLSVVVSVVVYGAIFTPLEHLVPRRPTPVLRRDLAQDAMFLLGNFLLWTPLVGAVLILVHHGIRLLPVAAIQEPFAGLPAVMQVVVALLIGDLATYGFHRACHAWAPLWRFHRVHHSSEHLDWVAAYREHPVDNLLTRLVENLPLLVLGLPLAWVAGIAAFRGLWALFIHSNIDWSPPRPMAAILGSPRLHRWHHEPVASRHVNFANLNPLMDLCFGTYRHPDRDPDQLGDPEQPHRSYVGHLIAAFQRR